MVRDGVNEAAERAARKRKLSKIASARTKLAKAHADHGVPRYEARQAALAAVKRREAAAERSWCILRTNSRRTITLAQSLNDAGIEAWTPQETRKRRLPRGRKGFKETIEPIVPSFVFARASHLPDIMNALALPSNPHPPFSIFQYAGRAPVIADREIANLQKVEDDARKAVLKGKRHDIAIGTMVRPTDGAFAGLDGVVQQVRGKVAEVLFNERFRVKVATWLLIGDGVNASASHSGTAALAA